MGVVDIGVCECQQEARGVEVPLHFFQLDRADLEDVAQDHVYDDDEPQQGVEPRRGLPHPGVERVDRPCETVPGGRGHGSVPIATAATSDGPCRSSHGPWICITSKY